MGDKGKGEDWMRFFTTAVVNWFDDGCCDAKYLDMWSDAPLSYTPGQATGPGWYNDQYDVVLARESDGRLFQKAADLLLHYQFYPNTILSFFGDFNLGPGRRLRVGDRIVQRFHIARLFGRAVFDIIGLTEVHQVITEPRHQSLTIITAKPHVMEGKWAVHVTWHENGDLALTVDIISRPSPQEPARNHPFMRTLQKKAHHAGIAHFQKLLLG